jgi:hypothetical protein
MEAIAPTSSPPDIEDLPGFDLVTGAPADASGLPPPAKSVCGVVELSRREDASTALPKVWEALVLRRKNNVRHNALIDVLYNMDLSDPKWRVLVLWTKDPGAIAEFLAKAHPLTGKTLFDAWPAVYVVVTLNGHYPDLEPGVKQANIAQIMLDFQDLAALMVAKKGGAPKDHIYVKVGDPFLRYRRAGESEIRTNLGDVEFLFPNLAYLGFKTVHYGPLDTRGKWGRAVGMARERGIELIPFAWTEGDPEILAIVEKMAKLAHENGLRLATCSDRGNVGKRFETESGDDGERTKKIMTGICVSLSALNKLLRRAGAPTIPAKGSTKPKGNRTCDCQETADIGANVVRNTTDPRRMCRRCVYCFVACKSASGGGKRKRA